MQSRSINSLLRIASCLQSQKRMISRRGRRRGHRTLSSNCRCATRAAGRSPPGHDVVVIIEGLALPRKRALAAVREPTPDQSRKKFRKGFAESSV